MRRLVVLALTLALSLSLVACSSNKTEEPSADGDVPTLKVGMECAYAPFNWTQVDDSNGAVKLADGTYAGGYDVEIAKQIADELGMELEIVKTAWDGLLPGITSGKLDLIIAGMSPTAERMETIDFTDAYYNSNLVLVVKKDSPFASATSIQDFSGAKVVGQLNTFHATVVSQINGVDEQNPMDTFGTMLSAVSSGKVDAYVSEEPGAVSAVAANPELTYVKFADGQGFEASVEDTSIAIGLKKGSDLTSQINEVLSTISDDTRLDIMNTAVANQPAA